MESLKEVASASAAMYQRDKKVKDAETARDYFKTCAIEMEANYAKERGKTTALEERLEAVSCDYAMLKDRQQEAAKRERKLIGELEASRELGASAVTAAENAGLPMESSTDASIKAASQRAVYKPSSQTLALLSPSRRKDLKEKLGIKEEGQTLKRGGGEESGAVEAQLRAEVAILKGEIQRLKAENQQP